MRLASAALSALLLLAAAGGCGKVKLKPVEIKDVVQVTVDGDGFKPDHIPAKRGKPLTLVFNRTSDKTCATEVVIASERIRKELPLNKQTFVTFIPEKTGEVAFACPMNMVKGSITVIP